MANLRQLASILAGIYVAGILLMPIRVDASATIPEEEQGRPIRVLILNGTEKVNLKIRGKFNLIDPLTNRILVQGRKLSQTTLSVSGERGIRVGEDQYSLHWIRFIAQKDVTIQVTSGTKRYRGEIDVIVDKNNHLQIINRVGLEYYVAGVLYHETPHRWPMETLMAQAVAARTYALYQISRNTKSNFDVRSDIYSQVYGGRSGERYRTNLAVKRTLGEAMTFKGEIIPAYYHSTCGGHTENVEELWPKDAMTPLKGVRCPYCVNSPHYSWKKNFRLKDIQDKLNARGYKLGLIKELLVTDRDDSGRIRTMTIITRDGKEAVISGKDFREFVGPNNLKSNNYRVVMQGYYVDLVGSGWGHGVGMCQWGNRQMSRQGYDHTEILKFYYPGIEIVDYRQMK